MIKLTTAIICILLSLCSISFAQNNFTRQANCKIKDQSGTIDNTYCQHSKRGNIRCYADIQWENGKTERLWGKKCWSSYSDCWSSGDGHIDGFCKE